jgi:hypothetical protein
MSGGCISPGARGMGGMPCMLPVLARLAVLGPFILRLPLSVAEDDGSPPCRCVSHKSVSGSSKVFV